MEEKNQSLKCTLSQLSLDYIPDVEYIFLDSKFNQDISNWYTINLN